MSAALQSLLCTCLPLVDDNKLFMRQEAQCFMEIREEGGGEEGYVGGGHAVSPVGSLITGIKTPLCAGKSPLTLKAPRIFFFLRNTSSMSARSLRLRLLISL